TNIRIWGVLLRRTAAVKYPVISVRTSVHDANPQLPADRRTARSRHSPAAEASPTGPHLAALSLTTLGVVYGDIGTSPLYALRACFNAEYGLAPTGSTVYGVLSLIVWSLIPIVSVKYIIVVMRLDNHGEGGIVALLALLRQKRRRGVLLALGLFGAALLYGDGVITPAISVLSAAEGLEVATPAFKPYVLPSTLLILFLLFFVQKYGPARVGSVFGPGSPVLPVPYAVQNPFYLLAPRAFLYPLVAIATLATVVASQALISGAFSLTQQCVQLHYSPRVSIVHTSRSEVGQIYIPEVNTALMIGCLLLVLGFESSSALGAAYGVAVTGTMAVTTVLFYVIARQRWHWSGLRAGALAGAFLVIDLTFFGANIIKIEHGGWVSLAIGGGVFLLMGTWSRGTDLLRGFLAQAAVPMDHFLDEVERTKPPRVRGAAVFLSHDVDAAPLVLQRHLRYNKGLHEQIILRSIITQEVPEVEHEKRVIIEALPQGFHRVRAYYGFMERPDVGEIIVLCGDLGIKGEAEETTYYVDSARLLPTGPAPMMRWRKRLFSFMARNASAATDFFNIPPNRVVELGARLEF